MIDIGQMVRSANPVSGDSVLTDDERDALLHLIDTRSKSMQTVEKMAPVKAPKPSRAPWLVAAAVFIAVLVIGGAVLLTLPGGGETSPARPTETTTPTTAAPDTTIAAIVEEPEPAEEQVATPTTSATLPDPTPEQIAMAQQIVDARNSGDFDAWLSLMNPDADLAAPFNVRELATMGSEDIEVELDKVRDAMAFETVLNGEWTLDNCRVADWTEAINWSTSVSPDSGQAISCDLSYTDDFVEAAAQGNFEFEMIVLGSQGAVAVHEIHYRSVDVVLDTWDPFLIWLETQSLDDALVAGRVESGYRDMPWRGWVPKWTEASASMIAANLDAYVSASG